MFLTARFGILGLRLYIYYGLPETQTRNFGCVFCVSTKICFCMNLRLYVIGLFLSSLLGGIVAITGYKLLMPDRNYESIEQKQSQGFTQQVANRTLDTALALVPQDFTQAAGRVRPAVVHIKTRYRGQITARPDADGQKPESDDWFRGFHDFENPFKGGVPRESAGSGVIISTDGYIATNNHVIENASEIEVVLDDKRSYAATVIGTDPTTDLALIKIEERQLPFVRYGDSNRLLIGEWVLAVGNPFDLTSTVTAGIVSAKGRNINILKTKDNLQVESFIQTDAAVNPGNSGGALVNLRGELVGINTAIATKTGVSEGYSFSVPVSLAKKVMDDLLRYGSVQRGLLGVIIVDIDAKKAQENGLDKVRGVWVEQINENGAAQYAGIKPDDVITGIGGQPVNSTAELQSIVATFRPGDRIKLTIERNGEVKPVWVTLRNTEGNTYMPKPKLEKTLNIFGADMIPVSAQEKKALGLAKGVKVLRVSEGRIKDAGIKVGFIITQIDDKPVGSAEEIFKIINTGRRAIVVGGVFANGTKAYHAIAP